MKGRDHGRARRRLRLQDLQGHQLGLRVQPGDRLVQHQQRRARGQQPRQQHPRPLPARHGEDAAPLQARQPDRRQRLVRPLLRHIRRLGDRAQRRHRQGVYAPGHAPLLRQVAGQPRPRLRPHPARVLPEQPRLALHRQEAQHGLQQRRLARPVRPADGDEPSRLQGRGDALQHLAPAEARAHVLQLDGGPGDLCGHARQLRAARQATRANRGAPTSAVNTPSFSS